MATTTTVKDNEGREFTVKLNSYSQASAVWLMGIDSDDPFDRSGTFTLDAARQLRDDLTTVITEVEEFLKPKPLDAEALRALPTGAGVVYGNNRRYIKTDGGDFVKIAGDGNFPIGTIYSVIELAGLVYVEEVN